ncbi:MAG: dTDP-glucose 4,6-dehydratase [Candidatus Woesearchaeota archaeon]|jgi:dTDP-glucose 4,6-dehydratase|nr:dTDP-glucose 4,6-dehydratase [Candidatus Woesearchaeota archaeon]
MKILVTGGAGFIASNFIRLILNKHPEYTVVNFDKLTYCGNLENLKDVETNPKYQFVKGDICDEKQVNEVIKDIDIVYHFAAESHVDNSIKDPFVFTKTNVIGTHVLLEAARKAKIKRFIHVSTDEVYGSVPEGLSKETDSLLPNSPYSASKTASDLLVRSYHETYGLPIIITRSSNNFGPYQYPEKLIPLFVTNLLEDKKVPLYGDGLNVRDWIYVKDNCEGILFAGENGKTGTIYNIGGGNLEPNVKITEALLKILSKDKSSIEYVKDRLGHDRRYALDSSKMHQLGWKPKYDFNTALKETVQWYKDNKEWWKPLKVKK